MLGCCCAAQDTTDASGPKFVEAKAAVTADEEIPIKAVAPPPELKPKVESKPAPKTGRDFFTASFDFEVLKAAGDTWGIEADPMDGAVMEVCVIRDGLISKYNASVKDENEQMKLGDYIVSINGVKGDTDAMVTVMQKPSRKTVSVRRLKTWEVNLKQSGAALRPCMNRASNGRTLLIVDADDKIFKDWNLANPDLDIQKNDRILMINGIDSESEKMMEQVEQASDLKILVGRPSPA